MINEGLYTTLSNKYPEILILKFPSEIISGWHNCQPLFCKSKIKVMLSVFFGIRGVVHSKFLPEGQTVNKEYYLSVIKRLRECDNAPAHKAIIVNEFLNKNSTNIIEKPPAVLSRYGFFWLFPVSKTQITTSLKILKLIRNKN